MAIPILLWVITGFIFLTKPGYQEAYEQLSPRLYPIEQSITIPVSGKWSEVRLIRTTLGHHLLVSANGGQKNLHPLSFAEAPLPSKDDLFTLINDATSYNTERYGKAVSVTDNQITTNTGVVISINWQAMTLHQQGSDTKFINTLYKIHYLQWLGETTANKVLGILGLLLLLWLIILGLYNYARART